MTQEISPTQYLVGLWSQRNRDGGCQRSCYAKTGGDYFMAKIFVCDAVNFEVNKLKVWFQKRRRLDLANKSVVDWHNFSLLLTYIISG